MKRVFRYRAEAGRGNAIRGALAASCCAAFLIGSEPHPIVAAILVSMTVLFAGFAVRALLKRRINFELSEEVFCRTGDQDKGVSWKELAEVRLDFYTTRRDRDSGWMILRVRDRNGNAVSIDSDLDGFEDLVSIAEKAANDAGVELSVSTLTNMNAVAGRG